MNQDYLEYLSVLGFSPQPWGPLGTTSDEVPLSSSTRVLFVLASAPTPEESTLLERMTQAMGLQKTDFQTTTVTDQKSPLEATVVIGVGVEQIQIVSTESKPISFFEIPSLSQMLTQPESKKAAWNILQQTMKTLQSHSGTLVT